MAKLYMVLEKHSGVNVGFAHIDVPVGGPFFFWTREDAQKVADKATCNAGAEVYEIDAALLSVVPPAPINPPIGDDPNGLVIDASKLIA